MLSERTRAIEERVRAGYGYHRDSMVVRNFPGVLEVLSSIPNVRLIRRGTQIRIDGQCAKWDIRLDGKPADIDDLQTLSPRDVAMMEVYTRALSTPSELMSSRGCPVVVWTKRGLGKQ